MSEIYEYWPYSDVTTDSPSIYDGVEVFLEQYAKEHSVKRDLFCAYWLQAEVLNGGLEQFFSNSTGVLAPEAIQAINKIGLQNLAKNLEYAVTLFGRNYPRSRELRNKKLPSLVEKLESIEDEFINNLYTESGGLEKMAKKYVSSMHS
ncbi:DMP19 family protein [Aurantivibrio infirmus]